ncbi:MAG: galactofuranose ABC transporter, permease protein YjfF [Verrucomicrobiales bacterium]
MFFGADKADAGGYSRAGVRQDPVAARRDPGRLRVLLGGPEDRSLVLGLSVRENLILAMQARRGIARRLPAARQRELAEHYIKALRIKTPGPETPVGSLSGGNQQRVLLARWLCLSPKLIILDEPTRGIDVGAKAEIEKLARDLCAEGTAILFISSELEEIVRVCGRIAVMRDREEGRRAERRGGDRGEHHGEDRRPRRRERGRRMSGAANAKRHAWPPALWAFCSIAALLAFNAIFDPDFFALSTVGGQPLRTAGQRRAAGGQSDDPRHRDDAGHRDGRSGLSVGSIMAVAGSAAALCLRDSAMGFAAAGAIALGGGMLAGTVGGGLVAFARIQPIIATLILMVLGRGVALNLTGAQPIAADSESLLFLGRGFVLGIPMPVIAAAALLLGAILFTRLTAAGLFVEAVGGNETASRLCGINARTVKLLAYAFSGTCAALMRLDLGRRRRADRAGPHWKYVRAGRDHRRGRGRHRADRRALHPRRLDHRRDFDPGADRHADPVRDAVGCRAGAQGGRHRRRLPVPKPDLARPRRADRTPPPTCMNAIRQHLPTLATAAVLVALFGAFSAAFDNFLSARVIANLFVNNAHVGIIAVGMTFVILSGGIDLSVGSALAFSTTLIAYLIGEAGWHPAAAIPAALACGTAFGAAMGGIIQGFRLPPFLVTLAGMFFLRGMSYVVSDESLGIAHDFYTAVVDFGIPVARGVRIKAVALLFVGVVLAGIYLAHFTRFGRNVYAVGGGESSAILMGLPAARTKVLIYALSGFCASLGGVAFTFYTQSGNPLNGMGLELDAIAAVVIGGTLLTGGSGSVAGTLLGVLIYGTILTALDFHGGLDSSWQRISIGILLLLFILLQRALTSRAEARA